MKGPGVDGTILRSSTPSPGHREQQDGSGGGGKGGALLINPQGLIWGGGPEEQGRTNVINVAWEAGPVTFNLKLLSAGESMHTPQSMTYGGLRTTCERWWFFTMGGSGCEIWCFDPLSHLTSLTKVVFCALSWEKLSPFSILFGQAQL